MFILYRLTFSNGKHYIGQTVRTMRLRLQQHNRSARSGSLLPVHCAWRKHGAPTAEVIAEYESQEDLHIAEVAAIKALNSLCPSGYNVSLGGDTAPSKSPDVAAKISKAATGRKVADTSNMSAAAKALWAGDEYRKKVSEALKAGWDDARRLAASERAKARWAKRKEEGWSMPDETKQKLAARVVSMEARQKMSAAAKGKPKAARSEETRAKLAESIKRSWSDPEIRARRLSAIKAAKAAM